MFRLKKVIISIWIILIATMGYFAIKVPGILSGSGFDTNGEYKKVSDVLHNDFHQPTDSLILLFHQKENVTNDAFIKEVSSITAKTSDVKEVSSVSSPVYHQQYVYITVSYNASSKELDPLLNNLSKITDKNSVVQTSITGSPVIEKEMNTSSQNDLKKAEMIGLPVALIVLLLAFGGLIAASIPLLTGIVTVVATMGMIYFIGKWIHLSVFVLNVVPMIGLALSIDFSLLYINRFREELKQSEPKEAIEKTMKTAGRSIAFSGLCVVLGLSGLLFIHIDIFQSIAVGGIAVVVMAVLSALTFLPALLGWLGHRVNNIRFLKEKNGKHTKWRKFAYFVMKRPIWMMVFSLVILIIGLLPVRSMTLDIPDVKSLPKTSQVRMTYETFEKNFIHKNESQVQVIVHTKDSSTSEASLEKLEKTVNQFKKQKDVKKVDSIFSLAGNMDAKTLSLMVKNPVYKEKLIPLLKQMTTKHQSLIYVTLDKASDSTEAKQWAKEIDEKHFALPFIVGGEAKYNQEIYGEIGKQVPKGLSMIFITTFIILMFAFRSVVIPLKAIMMNILSLGSAFGIVVWIFQGGHFGIEASPIGLMIPILTFAVVFGLSMDYEVFLISRIQEEYLKTNDNNQATLDGLTSTSKIISAAAAIMIVVTGAFSFTDIMPVKQIGIGIALSIFIDATLVRMILVPSLMKLLGKWNWWMPFTKK